MKIAIILGSVRDGRVGAAVADWVFESAKARGDADYELIDLKSFHLPVLESAVVPGAANKQYDNAQVQKWGDTIDTCDAYVFVTPEYNHSVPGGFKNAFDSIGGEWAGKAVGFVSYGADSGVRAVEHWRTIVANFHMHDVRGQVSLSTFTEVGKDGLTLADRREGELNALFDQVIAATKI